MRLRSSCICMSIALFLVLASGCSRGNTESSPRILGRWRVIDKQGINIPHSFFRCMMDYVEFRQEGIMWGLLKWPPDDGNEFRHNGTGEYVLVGEHQIEFVGDCRHQGPCTGSYTLTWKGDTLHILGENEKWILEWIGPPSEVLPSAIEGPSPTSTPVPTE